MLVILVENENPRPTPILPIDAKQNQISSTKEQHKKSCTYSKNKDAKKDAQKDV